MVSPGLRRRACAPRASPPTAPTSGWRTAAATTSRSCGRATAPTWAPSPWEYPARASTAPTSGRQLRATATVCAKPRSALRRRHHLGPLGCLRGHMWVQPMTSLRAFDGANLGRPVPAGGHNVTKLRASTAPPGTFPVTVSPRRGLRWRQHLGDELGSDNVTKLRASDGATLGTFPVGRVAPLAWPSTAPTSGWRTQNSNATKLP